MKNPVLQENLIKAVQDAQVYFFKPPYILHISKKMETAPSGNRFCIFMQLLDARLKRMGSLFRKGFADLLSLPRTVDIMVDGGDF